MSASIFDGRVTIHITQLPKAETILTEISTSWIRKTINGHFL